LCLCGLHYIRLEEITPDIVGVDEDRGDSTEDGVEAKVPNLVDYLLGYGDRNDR
jgi:hypothetical protein